MSGRADAAADVAVGPDAAVAAEPLSTPVALFAALRGLVPASFVAPANPLAVLVHSLRSLVRSTVRMADPVDQWLVEASKSASTGYQLDCSPTAPASSFAEAKA